MRADIDRPRFAEHLREAMTRRGLTQAALAAELGLTQQAVNDWANGKKSPGRKNLQKLVTLLGLNPEHFTTPEKPYRFPLSSDVSDVVYIPRNGHAAAGEGYEGDEDPTSHAPYPRSELQRITGANPERLRALTVVGDSLSPEIQPNSTVLYLPTADISDDGLYVVDLDGARKVKLVQRLAGGLLELIPLNERYHRERLIPLPEADTPNTFRSELTGATATLRVIGKVVYYGKSA